MKLSDLIKSSIAVGDYVKDDEFKQAIDKMREAKAKSLIDGLVSIMNDFHTQANELAREAGEAKKVYEKAEASVNAAKRALDYFGVTKNPLPVFAALFDKEGGKEWCRANGVEVPCDSSAAWKVPDGWTVKTSSGDANV